MRRVPLGHVYMRARARAARRCTGPLSRTSSHTSSGYDDGSSGAARLSAPASAPFPRGPLRVVHRVAEPLAGRAGAGNGCFASRVGFCGADPLGGHFGHPIFHCSLCMTHIRPSSCARQLPHSHLGSRPSTTHTFGGLISLTAFGSPRVWGRGAWPLSAASQAAAAHDYILRWREWEHGCGRNPLGFEP